MEHVLDSYGTGPKGPLACDQVSKLSSSKISSLNKVPKPITKTDQEALENKARLRAYERYKDPEIRSEQHFKLYNRLVRLSTIHTRTNTRKNVDKKAVDRIVRLIENHGWSHDLGTIIVTDDSIVPPAGPGTKLRSHLLPPAFTILHGQIYIDALEAVLNNGHVIPDKIIVEVAIPDQGTSMGDTEVRLLEMKMRLNRFAPQYRRTLRKSVTPTKTSAVQKQVPPATSVWNNAGKDLRRVVLLRSWLRTSPDFCTMTVRSLGTGSVARAASQAVKEGLLTRDNEALDIQQKHLQRYIRAVLLFNHAPKTFELYERSVNEKKGLLSIVTLNAAALLRAEPDLKLLIVEAMLAHLEKRQKRFARTQDTSFLRNIVNLYTIVKESAGTLGYKGTSFLRAIVGHTSGENGTTRTCTLREAIIRIASDEHMSMDEYDISEIAGRLKDTLAAAKNGTRTHLLPAIGGTETLSLSNSGKLLKGREVCNITDVLQKDGREAAEETSSMCLARANRPRQYENAYTFEESSNIRSEDSEAQKQEQAYIVRDSHVAAKDTSRGQKRLGSPEPLSILRRKVLKRNRPLGTRGLESRNPNSGMLNNNINNCKKISIMSPSAGKNMSHAEFPACIPEHHRARRDLTMSDVVSLRKELRSYSSKKSCAHHGTFKEVHNREAGTVVLQHIQFTTFWSDHRAALEGKGYTQIMLPSPWLTSSANKIMKNAGYLHSQVDKGERRYRKGVVKGDCPWPEMCKDPMVLQTALSVVAEWLGLYNVENGLSSHAISETGCSLLLLPEESNMQKPRLAFALRSRNGNSNAWNPPRDPSYMFVVTADRGFPMWIWERTHVILSGPSELLPVIAKYAKPKRIYIEPRSIFLCRGDVVHAFGAISDVDGHHPAKPVAVMSHLVQCSIDELGQPDSDGWWMDFISTPSS